MLEHGIKARGLAGLDHLEQRHLHEDALGSHLSLTPLGRTQHLHHSSQGIRVDVFGLSSECPHLSFTDIEQTRLGPGNQKEQQIAEMIEQVRQQTSQVFTGTGQLLQKPQGGGNVALQKRVHQLHELSTGRQAEHRQHIGFDNPVTAKADQLVQSRLGIPHAAVRTTGDGQEGVRIDRDLLLLGDPSQMLDDECRWDTTKVKPLASTQNRRQNLLGIGRREEKLHMRRGLFQRLEQRIESRCREHVNLVDDVDFVFARGGRKLGRIPQLTNLVDAVVRSTVDLQYVQGAPLGDFLHPRVGIVELNAGSTGAIERLGKDARQGGLACTTRPTEQIAMRDPPQTNGVGQGGGHMFLPHHVGKTLGTVFSGDDLVTHG